MSVLPASPPAQLYRFGFEPPAAKVAVARGEKLRLTLVSIALPAASAGSGILTSRGDSLAYIAHARWVAPAATLVDEATVQAFSAAGIGLTRSAAGAVAGLALEVQTLETRYTEASSPTVRIVIHAVLTRPDGQPLAEQTFAFEQRAEANRVSAIVAAYDAALTEDLEAITRWGAGARPTIADARTADGSARP